MPSKIDDKILNTLGDMLHEEQMGEHEVLEPEVLWHPSLGDTQKEIFNSAARFILVSGERGTGKCVKEGTRLWTREGLERIESFSRGSGTGAHPISRSVLSFDERNFEEGKVSAFYREENPEAIEFELENGQRPVTSPRHPMWVEVSGSIGWVPAAEIRELIGGGKEVFTPLKVGNPIWKGDYHTFSVPNRCRATSKKWDQKAVEGGKKVRRKKGPSRSYTKEVTLDEDIGYIVGSLIGDGGMTNRDVVISSADQELLDLFSRILSSKFSGELKHTSGYDYAIRGCDGILSNFLLQLGLLGEKSYSKFVPEAFFTSPPSVVCSFLRGLFDTDGTVDHGIHISLSTVSRELAEGVQMLLCALGVLSVIQPKKRKSGDSFNVVIQGGDVDEFMRLVGFGLSRKAQKVRCGAKRNPNKFTYPSSIVGEMKKVFSGSKIKGRARAFVRASLNRGYTPSCGRLDSFIKDVGTSNQLEKYRVPGCRWVRITSAKKTTASLVDISVEKNHSFVAEGVINHNTFGILHKMVFHCWSERNAEALIIVGVRGQATHGGAWDKLLLEVVPEWKEGMGLEVSEPRRDEQQYWYVHVRNRHGGWSKITLLSFPHSMQVAGRIRGFEPSLVFVDELTTIGTAVYFEAIVQQLGRRPGIEGPQQYIASTNPDGPRHWVHKRFIAGPWDESKDEDGKVISPKGEWDKRYAYFQLGIEENKHNLPPGYYQSVIEATRNDPIEYRRMVFGEWVDRPDGEALFADSFRPEVHILKNKGKKSVAPIPRFPVVIGYDLGQTSNAVTFAQPVLTKATGLLWLIFDEIIHTNKKIPYDVLTRLILRKMEMWERICRSDLRWYHVSDDSAFNQYRPGDGGSFDHLQVLKWSEKYHKEFNLRGPIKMTPAPKFQGSKEARVRLTMQLLREDRILISERCSKHIDMFMSLQSEKTKDGNYDPAAAMKPKRSVHLHPFDSTSYIFLESELGMGRFITGRASPKVEIVTKDFLH